MLKFQFTYCSCYFCSQSGLNQNSKKQKMQFDDAVKLHGIVEDVAWIVKQTLLDYWWKL